MAPGPSDQTLFLFWIVGHLPTIIFDGRSRTYAPSGEVHYGTLVTCTRVELHYYTSIKLYELDDL